MITAIAIAAKMAAMFAPALLPRLNGSRARDTAGQVLDIARTALDLPDATPDELDAAIAQDPQAAARVREVLADLEAQLAREETERFHIQSENYRTDVSSSDPYVRRMRPTMGYAFIATWVFQALAFTGMAIAAMLQAPIEAVNLLGAIAGVVAAFQVMWLAALSVMGIYVKGRSDEKKGNPGLLNTLGAAVAGMARRG